MPAKRLISNALHESSRAEPLFFVAIPSEPCIERVFLFVVIPTERSDQERFSIARFSSDESLVDSAPPPTSMSRRHAAVAYSRSAGVSPALLLFAVAVAGALMLADCQDGA